MRLRYYQTKDKQIITRFEAAAGGLQVIADRNARIKFSSVGKKSAPLRVVSDAVQRLSTGAYGRSGNALRSLKGITATASSVTNQRGYPQKKGELHDGRTR
jgi:hypothetical protein